MADDKMDIKIEHDKGYKSIRGNFKDYSAIIGYFGCKINLYRDDSEVSNNHFNDEFLKRAEQILKQSGCSKIGAYFDSGDYWMKH